MHIVSESVNFTGHLAEHIIMILQDIDKDFILLTLSSDKSFESFFQVLPLLVPLKILGAPLLVGYNVLGA